MIHVGLRILVWMLVLGIGYLVFGPRLFDSSDHASPFDNRAELFLPPAKTQRELEYEDLRQRRTLSPEELTEYEALVRNRRAAFWKGSDLSVAEALSGVATQRKAHLAALLRQRGLTDEEVGVFLTVVGRDQPALLVDKQ